MLRIALVGLGYWGPNYARVVGELPDAELVAACDLSADALELVRARYPMVRATQDLDAVLSADDVDAVIVATPTSTHLRLALAALRAGKHVLCEKPLAETVAECDELIAAAEGAGRVLLVGHTFVFNPAVQHMRELIGSGDVGRVLYCHAARTGLGPIRQDVNVLWDLAPHDLSIFLHLFDAAPVSVAAAGQAFLREGWEDVAFLTVRFDDGAIAAAHLSWLDPTKTRRVTVVGDRRMLVFDDVSLEERLRVYDRGASYEAVSEAARGAEFGEFKALIRDGDVHVPKLPAAEPLKEQVAHFVARCGDGGDSPVDAAAGRRVVALLEAATESLHAGGAPVDLAQAAAR